MYSPSVQKLIDLFTKFPGIGPRQAGRLVFFLLKENGDLAKDLALAITEAKDKTVSCRQCFRSMEKNDKDLCLLCLDSKRDTASLAIVEKESDLQALERSGVHIGQYHVLGGVISPLDADSPKRLHLRELFERTKNILEKNNRAEIVLSTSATTEGDTTALYIERVLTPLKNHYPDFKISRLGRGLSLGSELEYADETTVKNAFLNRK